MNKLKIIFIIVNWNGGEKLFKCVKSLYKFSEGINFKIIIIDNDSKDNSVEVIRKSFPGLILIRNKKNVGYGKANNIGLKYLKENKIVSDYIAFVNNDIIVKEGDFKKLINFMDRHKEIVALTPVIIEKEEKFQVGIGGRKFSLFHLFSYYFFLNKLPIFRKTGINLNQAYFVKHKKIIELDWLSGTFLIVRFEKIKNSSLFPDEIFMYFEDVILSRKLKEEGKLIFYPFLTIFHNRNVRDESLFLFYNSYFNYLKSVLKPWKFRIGCCLITGGLYLRLCLYNVLKKKKNAQLLKKQLKIFRRIKLLD